MTHQFPTYQIKGKTVEYKTVSFRVKNVDQKEGIVTGLASPVTNIDKQKDQVERGAYTKTLNEGQGRMENGRRFMYACLWMHEPTQPIGGVLGGQEDPDGLEVTMKYDISVNSAGIPNNPIATMVFSGLDMGYIDELSIGYIPVKYDYDKQGVRHLREIQLVEISAVTMLFAANPEALVPASGVKTIMPEKIQKKDFDTLFQATQAADCLEDLGDLLNTFIQAAIQAFGMGDQPQEDMQQCVEQFGTAVAKWTEDAVASNLKDYIAQRGYCGDGTPYVPYSMRVGGYDYASRHDAIAGKSGRAISSANQNALEQHQADMKNSLDAIQDHCKTMQDKVSNLAQMWQGNDQQDEDENNKSIARREPSRTLTRDAQPLHKSTGDLSIEDLEALLA